MASPDKQVADERAYLYDDPELNITATDKENKHWDRWKGRYLHCIELAGKKGGKWLDVACGSGYGTEIISQYADKVVGADLDYNTILYAQKHHKSNDKIEFIQQDIAELNLDENDKFDVVLSIETIEHISDANPFLTSVSKILAKDGVFVVTTPESLYGGGPNPHNVYHLNEYTIPQFRELLEKYFGNVEITTSKAIFSTGIETTQVYAKCSGVKK